MAYNCPQHGDLLTKQLLVEHMALKHGVQLEKVGPPLELQEQIKRIDAKKAEAPQIPLPTPQPAPQIKLEIKVQIQPIILEYRYKGNCQCGQPVSTIYFAEFLGKAVVTAYCRNCDVALEKRIVKPLNTIAKKEEKNVRDTSTPQKISKSKKV